METTINPLKGSPLEFGCYFGGCRGWVWKGLILMQSPLFLPFMWAEEKVENGISSCQTPFMPGTRHLFKSHLTAIDGLLDGLEQHFRSDSNAWGSVWGRRYSSGLCLNEVTYSFSNISNYQHYNWNSEVIYLKKGSRGQSHFIKTWVASLVPMSAEQMSFISKGCRQRWRGEKEMVQT